MIQLDYNINITIIMTVIDDKRARERKKEGEGKQKRAAGMNVPISDPSLRVRLLRMRSLYLASGRFRSAKQSL